MKASATFHNDTGMSAPGSAQGEPFAAQVNAGAPRRVFVAVTSRAKFAGMTEVLVTCPHCGKVIPEKDSRRERPFSCPTCRQIVAVLDPYKRLSMSGCLFSFISVIVLAGFIGFTRAYGYLLEIAIGGVMLGAALGVGVALGIFRAMRRWRPKPPQYEKHELREVPALLLDIAKFLESLAVLQTWTSEQDRQLDSLAKQDSLDEPLVGAALVAARELKSRLSGRSTPGKESSKEIQPLDLAGLCKELAAISANLRAAAS